MSKNLWFVFLIFAGCSGTTFTGSTSEQPSKKPSADEIAPVTNNEEDLGSSSLGEETASNHSDIDIFDHLDDFDASNNVDSDFDVVTPIVNPSPVAIPDIVPSAVVDGQEVFTDCNSCLARAKKLAATIGFAANMNQTINLGFYKIPPSKGLCDIHFMSDMTLPVDDHEGVDSVGNGQVMLYCPCNCNWAQTDGPIYP